MDWLAVESSQRILTVVVALEHPGLEPVQLEPDHLGLILHP